MEVVADSMKPQVIMASIHLTSLFLKMDPYKMAGADLIAHLLEPARPSVSLSLTRMNGQQNLVDNSFLPCQ